MAPKSLASPARDVRRALDAETSAPAGAPPNQRASYRHKPRRDAQVVCRRLPAEDGENLFVSLLDVSREGVRLVLRAAVEQADHLCICVAGPRSREPQWLLAYVVWSMPAAGGRDSCVGARFLRRLTDGELRAIAEL